MKHVSGDQFLTNSGIPKNPTATPAQTPLPASGSPNNIHHIQRNLISPVSVHAWKLCCQGPNGLFLIRMLGCSLFSANARNTAFRQRQWYYKMTLPRSEPANLVLKKDETVILAKETPLPGQLLAQMGLSIKFFRWDEGQRWLECMLIALCSTGTAF